MYSCEITTLNWKFPFLNVLSLFLKRWLQWYCGWGLWRPFCAKSPLDSTFSSLIHFFLVAFCAALVCLDCVSFLVTSLMTPTATVCLMSRTANLPKGGYWLNGSTHMGLLGTRSIIAASPDLMNFGMSSNFFPDRRSIFSLISTNLQAIWAVWQSNTGAYPDLISPGWFRIMTWK